MRPLLAAESKIPRSNDPGALLRSIPEKLAEAGVSFGGVRFVMTHEESRIVDRIVKAEPMLAGYRSERGSDLFMLSGDLDVADPAFEALCRVWARESRAGFRFATSPSDSFESIGGRSGRPLCPASNVIGRLEGAVVPQLEQAFGVAPAWAARF